MDAELLPGGFRRPSSVFVSGDSPSLLKWVMLALISPYFSRLYWTEIRLPGETLEPLDPLGLGIVPEDRVEVVHPGDLRTEDEEARRAASAAATMLRSDEPPEQLRRLTEFLRLPQRTQDRLSTASSTNEPAIIVASNAHLLLDMYPFEATGSAVRSFKDSGACLVLLCASAPPEGRSWFDVVLRLDGSGTSHWREATLTCEKGISSGPLASGAPCHLSDLGPIARILEKSLPPSSSGAH